MSTPNLSEDTESEYNGSWCSSNLIETSNWGGAYAYQKSGTLSSGSDLDLFNSSVYGESEFTVVARQMSGSAVCNAYTSASSRCSLTDANTDAMTDQGVLSTTSKNITLSDAGEKYLYIKCSGSAGDTYEVRVVSGSTAASGDFASFAYLSALTCSTAKTGCQTGCSQQYYY